VKLSARKSWIRKQYFHVEVLMFISRSGKSGIYIISFKNWGGCERKEQARWSKMEMMQVFVTILAMYMQTTDTTYYSLRWQNK
jgi:hypothetical protein